MARLGSSAVQAALFHSRERRVAQRRLQEFAAEIASPADLGTESPDTDLPSPYTWPAALRLAVSHDQGVSAGELIVKVNDRAYETPDLAADEIFRLDVASPAQAVTAQSSVDGVITIYVLDDWGRPSAVATGTVAT